MHAIPFVTLPDPKVKAEGSIDPLGVGNMADRLADMMLPGITARMYRPRYLTAMAVSTLVTEGLERSPKGLRPDIAFEWGLVLAMAGLDDAPSGVPGMRKAQQTLREGAPMSSRHYLKTPTVFGFHGVYRTLAVELGIVTKTGELRSEGERLVAAWQSALDLPGFLEARAGSQGGDLRSKLRKMVEGTLEAEQLASVPGQLGSSLTAALRPDRMTRAEAEIVRALLDREEGGLRAELIALHDQPESQTALEAGEHAFFRAARPKMSAALGVVADAVFGLEGVARPMADIFDAARYVSAQQPNRPVSGSMLEAARPELPDDLAASAKRAVEACPQVEVSQEVSRLAAQLAEASGAVACFDATMSRHEYAQQRKPPDGKRPWFERVQDGFVVRTRYRLNDEVTPSHRFVNQYRSWAVQSFLADLGGAR